MFNLAIQSTDLEPVQLYGKAVQRLKNVTIRQTILAHLEQAFNIRLNCTNKYFRVLDEQTDIALLKKYPHMVYANTNQPINLVALVDFADQPRCLYIDKLKAEIYVIRCQFSPSLYDGTIFEGEVIETDQGRFFLISDLLTYRKKDLSGNKLDQRLSLLASLIGSTNYTSDPSLEPFRFLMKDFIEPSQINSFVNDYLATVPYRRVIKGLIFRPISHSNKNLIYHFPNLRGMWTTVQGPSQDQSKVNQDQPKAPMVTSALVALTRQKPLPPAVSKPVPKSVNHEETSPPQSKPNQSQVFQPKPKRTSLPKDFKLSAFQIDHNRYPEVNFLLYDQGNPDDYILKLVHPNGSPVEYSYALINDMRTSQYIQSYLDKASIQEKKNGICVQCQFHPIFKKWKPVKVIDKGQPTNLLDLVD